MRSLRFRRLSRMCADADRLRQARLLAEAGQAAWLLGMVTEAATIYEGLCVLMPDAPVGFVGLAEAHLFHRRFHEAEASARRAIHAPQCNRITMAYAYKLLGKALAGQQRGPAAIEAAQLVCELDPDGLGAELAREWSRSGGGLGSLRLQRPSERARSTGAKGNGPWVLN